MSCRVCGDKEWIVLQPMNYVAPCLNCAGHKTLDDIEKERNIILVQDDVGAWSEELLQ